MMKIFQLICLGAIVLLSGGCNRDIRQSFFDDIKLLNEENSQLKNRIDELERENRQLNEQVDTLSTLELSDRKKVFPIVNNLKVSGRSGFVDSDNDEVKDRIAVYVLPYDKDNDVIKAAGNLSIQLWDLNEAEENSKLYDMDISSQELAGHWANAFMKSYYKITLDINTSNMQAGKQYTLKVKFTDYVSGRVFDTQKVITY